MHCKIIIERELYSECDIILQGLENECKEEYSTHDIHHIQLECELFHNTIQPYVHEHFILHFWLEIVPYDGLTNQNRELDRPLIL